MKITRRGDIVLTILAVILGLLIGWFAEPFWWVRP